MSVALEHDVRFVAGAISYAGAFNCTRGLAETGSNTITISIAVPDLDAIAEPHTNAIANAIADADTIAHPIADADTIAHPQAITDPKTPPHAQAFPDAKARCGAGQRRK